MPGSLPSWQRAAAWGSGANAEVLTLSSHGDGFHELLLRFLHSLIVSVVAAPIRRHFASFDSLAHPVNRAAARGSDVRRFLRETISDIGHWGYSLLRN
jgi:hypothetical protein